MAKRKLTTEILDTLELCAKDEYTLDEIREEADIVIPLMKDTQVIAAIERGRDKWFIEVAATDGDLDPFIDNSEKTLDEVEKMFEVHKEAIEQRKAELKAEKQKVKAMQVDNSERALWAAGVSGHNIYSQHDEGNQKRISAKALADQVSKVVEDLKKGDTATLLEILVGNITQLNLFNGVVTRNLTADVGIPLDNFNKLSNMQLKVMQEERKSIMAINEIINPKRTTFIKEANQHNHLHQNSEKKSDNKNELQKQFNNHEEPAGVVVVGVKEVVNEKK